MKKLIFLLSVLLIIGSVSLAQSVSTITISGEDVPAVGGSVEIPINVSDFPAQVFGLLIYMEYDPAVASYTGIITNSDPTRLTVVNMTPSILRIQLFDPLWASFSVPDGEIVLLGFDYLGGDSELTFLTEDPYACEYLNETFVNVAIPTLNDGAILGGIVDNVIADGAWETSGDWSLGVVPNAFHNVTVEGNALISSEAVCNDLMIELDGRLTVADGFSLSVGGDIMIDSDPSGTGSFVNHGTFTHTGDATVKQFMTGALAYHLVSLPVDEVMSADVFMNCYLQYWDEPNSVWVDVQPDPDPMFSVAMNTPMMGYASAFHGAADNMLEFTGSLNDGTYSIVVTNDGTSGDADLDGWNLVGNPYPSALDVDGAGWTRDNVSHGVAYWDETIDNYRYYGAGVPGNGGSQFIPPMQGFFVKASDDGMIGVSNEARAHTSQLFYKSDPANTLRLAVQHNDFSDEAVVRFIEDATVNYDEQYDFFKLFVDNVPMIYSVTADNKSMAINAMPEIDEETIVNVGFKPGVNGQMTLTASGLETIDSSIPVWLYDAVAGQHQDLRQNAVYQFAANTEDDVNRFTILFKNLTSVPAIEQPAVNIFAYNKQLYVDAGTGNSGEIVVLNVLGQELVRERLNEQLNVISLPVSNSYVVVKVISDQGINTKKVFVN